jgi:hypothetical protein
MSLHKRTASWLVLIAAIMLVDACAQTLRRSAEPTTQTVSQLWEEPVDLEARDLFHGPGGAALAPRPVTYTFVAHKTSGTNPGYDVRDPEGQLWSVKLGVEAQSEVVVSRILWAVGFHQPPNYFVERWTFSGPGDSMQPGARFRPELKEHLVVGEWSWYENPFVGMRPFSGLVAANLLLNNWDLKTSNNKVYEVTNEDGVKERVYVVRDLGSSLGKARQAKFFNWFRIPFIRHRQGSKNDLEDFEAQGFIRAVEGEQVDIDYRGVNKALVGSLTVSDLRWTAALLSRLSERQLLDAFRAGGYSSDDSARYVRKIQEKIAQAAL